MSAEMRIGTLRVETEMLNESKRYVRLDEPRIVLSAMTGGGSVRTIPLTPNQTLELIKQAAHALSVIEARRTT